MPQEIFLLVGVPASGKTWVLDRAKPNYECVRHDDWIRHPRGYVPAIVAAAESSTRPVLAEAPFSMNKTMEPLIWAGHSVMPVFLIETENILLDRYRERGREEEHIIAGHLARQKTFYSRVSQYKAFSGTSLDVLNHLNLLAAERGK